MREILFRGKRTDNGEWVEGYIVPYSLNTYKTGIEIIDPDGINYDELDSYYPLFSSNQVDPETVCQFTGLTLLQTKVFEGDILECAVDYDDTFGYPATAIERMVVIWDEECCSFAVKTDGGIYSFGDLDWYETEVIGNIFDNPELMEGGGTVE